MATRDWHTKFREDQSTGSRDMLADRQTDTETHRQMGWSQYSAPLLGQSSKTESHQNFYKLGTSWFDLICQQKTWFKTYNFWPSVCYMRACLQTIQAVVCECSAQKLLYRNSCKCVELPATQCRLLFIAKIQMLHQPSWFFSVSQMYGLAVQLVCI